MLMPLVKISIGLCHQLLSTPVRRALQLTVRQSGQSQECRVKEHQHAVTFRNGDTNTSVFSATHTAGVANHQPIMASSNNIGIQPVSLLQTDSRIVAHSPIS